LSYSAVKGGSKREQEQVVMTCNCLVLLLLPPAPDPGRPRRNRTPCLSTQLFKVRFRRPMPGTRALSDML